MPDHGTYPIPPQFANAHITPESYATMYRQSLEDPDTFWAQRAGGILNLGSALDPTLRQRY